MEYFELLLNALITSLSVMAGGYVMFKIAYKTAKKDVITAVFELADDEEMRKRLYQYGYIFATGAANAIPMLRGLKGGKMKLEDVIMNAFGSMLGKAMPSAEAPQETSEAQTSNTLGL